MGSLPGWLQQSAYSLYLVGAGMVLWSLYQVIRGRSSVPEAFYMVAMAAMPVGVAAKVTQTGPEWFRYWLADMGFPLFIGWIVWELCSRRSDLWPVVGPGYTGWLIMSRYRLAGWSWALIVACGLSVVYEIVAGAMAAKANTMLPPGKKAPVGEFDWWDILMYLLGTLLGLALLLGQRWQRGRWLDAAREVDEVDAAIQRRATVRGRQAAQGQRRKDRRKKKK